MRRRICTIVFAGCVVIASGPASAQKSPMAQAVYARAQDHIAAGRFAEAATEMETAVRYEPRFALGWYVLASANRRAGQCDRAVAAYRRYMELRPAEADPYFGAGLCLHAVGDRQGAMSALQHYLETDTRPSSREFIEVAHRHLAELKRAVAETAAEPVKPPSPLLTEARQLRDSSRDEDAIVRYRAEIAINPRSVDARLELGTLLVSVRHFKEAVDELRAAVNLAPDAATAWYNLAFALRETDQATEAIDAYRRYITFKPKDADPHYGLGRALVMLGHDDEALVAFRAYVTLETRPTETRWLRKARAEIARIESGQATARQSASAASSAPSAPSAPVMAVPAPKPQSPSATEPPSAREP